MRALIFLFLIFFVGWVCAQTLTVNVFYPDSQICSNCGIVAATTDLTIMPSTPMTKVSPNQYQILIPYKPVQVAEQIEIEIIYGYTSAPPSFRFSANFDTFDFPLAHDQVGCPLPLGFLPNLGGRYFLTLQEQATEITIWPFFCTWQGTLETISVYSPELNNTRNLHVYTSPAFTENPLPRKYPLSIMYVHDGHIIVPQIAATLSSMITSGRVRGKNSKRFDQR